MGHRFDKKQPLFHGFDKIDHFLQKSHSLSEKSRFLQQVVYLVKTVKKWLFLIKSVPKWSKSLSLSVSKLAFLPHKAETHMTTFLQKSHSLSEISRFLQQVVYLVKTVKKLFFLIKYVPMWSISLSLSISKLASLSHKAA